MAPGALGGLNQVMPSLFWDTGQGCQPADPTLLEEGRSILTRAFPAPHQLLIRTQRLPEASAYQN